MNNIDLNYEKLNEIASKEFTVQLNKFKKNYPKNEFDIKDYQGDQAKRQKTNATAEEFKSLFNSSSELEKLNDLFLTFSSDEVFKFY